MIEELENLVGREPFRPFRIVVTSGGGYDVLSPLQLVSEKGKLTYYFPRSDRQAVLRVNQIVVLETLE